MIEKALRKLLDQEAAEEKQWRKEDREKERQAKLAAKQERKRKKEIERKHRQHVIPAIDRAESEYWQENVPSGFKSLCEEAKRLVEKQERIPSKRQISYGYEGTNPHFCSQEEAVSLWENGDINKNAIISCSVEYEASRELSRERIYGGHIVEKKHYRLIFELKRNGEASCHIGKYFNGRDHQGTFEELAEFIAEDIHWGRYSWVEKYDTLPPEPKYPATDRESFGHWGEHD